MSNMLDQIFGILGIGGGNNTPPPQNNTTLPKPDIINQPPVANTFIPDAPPQNPRMLNMPQGFMPVAKPFNISDQRPPVTLSDRLKGIGTGLLGNAMSFVDPQNQQQRMANLRFASKLAELSRPTVGVTNQGIGATIGNIGEAMQDYTGSYEKDIRQAGDQFFEILPDGTVIPIGGVDEAGVSKTQISQEASLRKEFMQASKEFIKINSSINKIRSSANGTASGDMAMIFAFMKVLDPTSTVREGEFANVENAKGWGDVVRGIYNKAKDGQRMTAPQRADFLRQSEELYATELATHKQREETYRQIAEANSLRPEVVVVNLITGDVTTNQTLTDLSEMSDDEIIKTLLNEDNQ